MRHFSRIICIWICCAFCPLERLQLPAVKAAVIAAPYDYFEDHEQLSYDLDTEQSKAKYDTRLLSAQLLKAEKSSSTETYEGAQQPRRERQHSSSPNGAESSSTAMDGANSKAASTADMDVDVDPDAEVDDLQPHERAASCHNNGHKYTHGQKVPRFDPCEVCLCMDGEIFCWWELCAKKPSSPTSPSSLTLSPDADNVVSESAAHHSNAQMDTSTVRILNEMSGNTAATTVATMVTAQQQQQEQQQHKQGKLQQHSRRLAKVQHPTTTKSFKKKKSYQQQQQQKHAQKTTKQLQQQLEQEQNMQHKHTRTHTHAHDHVLHASSYYATVGNGGIGSKILSFPENLPSVLYHDYRTEEHQHHQHQHHQQHLKHQQQQRLMQHLQQLQAQQHHAVTPAATLVSMPQHHHSSEHVLLYDTDADADDDDDDDDVADNDDGKFVAGDDSATEMDSDILPEPPTKKPKIAAAATTTTTIFTGTSTTATSMAALTMHDSNAVDAVATLKRDNKKSLKINDNVSAAAADNNRVASKNAGEDAATTAATSPTAKAAFALDDTSSAAEQKIAKHFEHATSKEQQRVAEDQDDAFHRWLTSTETNSNKRGTNSTKSQNESSYEDENLDTARKADLFAAPGGQANNNATAAASAATTVSAVTAAAAAAVARNNSNKIGNVYFRSSYNDYSSEYNGSVVNIDILLTTADEQQQRDSIVHPSGSSGMPQQHQQLAMATSDAADAGNRSATTLQVTTSTSTSSPERQCNVMGTLYKIGDVLPQDTGNCLQCVCIDGSTSDDTPRVTCSPHNCPPLVLPDLFDATGY